MPIEVKIKTKVIIIDTKGVISLDQNEALQRHKEYAEKLDKVLPSSKLCVISSCKRKFKSIRLPEYEHHFIKSNRIISFFYLSYCLKVISTSRDYGIILVAGNPWESATICRIIKILSRLIYGLSLPIQVQIHADIFDKKWLLQKKINRIRMLLVSSNVRKASQVRVVNNLTRDKLISKFKLSPEDIKVVPVVLNLPAFVSNGFYKERPKSIGFAGRFHRERGLEKFLKYISDLNLLDNDFKLILAGSGNDLDYFLAKVTDILTSKRVEFLGNLNRSEMLRFWSKVGVYVSTAESESFGRSIREAVYLGIPVIGVKTSGFEDLYELGISWVEYLDLSLDSSQKHRQFQRLQIKQTDMKAREILEKYNLQNLQELIDTWVSLFRIKYSG